MTAQKFKRGDGEILWHQPRHRIILPLTGADARTVTVQFEAGRSRQFVWHNSTGFYPAGTQARIATTAATSLQLLWTPDPETAGALEPLLPFDDPLVSMAAHAIARELDSEAPDRLFVESLGNVAIINVLRRFSKGPKTAFRLAPGLSQERLRRITEYIDAHLSHDLTLDAIAQVACLSPYHLSRSFRRAKGMGLHRYVVERRIDRAKQLVLNTDLSMAEIAWMVGFETQSAFTTRFRREVGQAPARLRRTV